MIDLFARVTPVLSAQGFSMVLALYVWAAARIVHASKRLPRPWAPVPELSMPRGVALLLAASVALIATDGFPAVLGAAMTGALFMAYVIQGLAAIHDRTRGKAARPLILSGLYVLMVASQGIAMPALSLYGLVDSVFGFRRRLGDGRRPPPTLSR